ncbi:hypothetical protein BOX15_Mlig012367g2 [Macrostomum lignano]|uniref:receptor protein-tyrosine kinase n=1 Tax=Macrostomum lignano TaxID=282301 RepID=A0A267E055_9PLAT|nr:hypothetical protein BOX15_Mlig012367g2 [Macrostomum lignano]
MSSCQLLTLLAVALASVTAAQQLTAYSKLCKTLELTHLDYASHLNASRLRDRLEEMVGGCQYLHGDLIISWWGVDRTTGRQLGGQLRDMRTDFLDRLIEISGRLIVAQSNLARLELRNLRAIRGHGTSDGDRPAIELSQCAHPIQLVLPRLAAIVQGGVQLYSATDRGLYCRITRSVVWSALFQQPGKQRVDYAGVSSCTRDSRPAACDCAGGSASAVACHPDCLSGCWSADTGACQSDGRCKKRACAFCYTRGLALEEECCHSACLGGCVGPNAKDCFSCRGVSYNGECRESCPKEYYDTETSKVIELPEPMVQVGNVCKRRCPAPFVLDSRRRYCLAECPNGELPVEGNCTACADTADGATSGCRVCESAERQLDDNLASSFANCSVWKLSSSFNLDGAAMSDRAWLGVASARIIFSIRVIVKRTEERAANLSVLRRLGYVSGELIINQLNASYLALSGLRSTQRLSIFNIRGLCRAWFPMEHLNSTSVGFPVSYGNLEFADCPDAACHPLCRGGCWGPGPGLCVACANASVDGVCYADCRQAGRYRSPAEEDAGRCLPCHAECGESGGCSGPSAHQCATCRAYRQDGACVASCAGNLEPDTYGVCYPASTMRLGVLAAGLALLLLLAAVAGLVAWRYYQRRLHRYDMVDLDEYLGDANSPNDMAQLLIVNDDDLIKQKEIGSGTFGTVYKGILRSETDCGYKELPVAIKVLKGSNPKLGQELLNEASVLARVRHPCCVRLVALCLTQDVQLVTNLMPRGCLLDFLRARQNSIGARRMLTWALQVAEAMAYLESINIVHRDLAARNVLLKTPDEVKITDFGLAKLLQNSERQLIYTSGAMPVKWLGIECFESGVFSHKSDVWSYGVLLWEICSYGEAPYKPYRISSVDDISNLLRKGVRLSQPPVCSVDFYNIMLTCWLPNPESRPNFTDLIASMKDCLTAPSAFIAFGPGMDGDADKIDDGGGGGGGGDGLDDPDAVVHIRERLGTPSAVVSSRFGSSAKPQQDSGQGEYTPMSSLVEPDEKDSLMTKESSRKPTTNNYVNDPLLNRPGIDSPVRTRRNPQQQQHQQHRHYQKSPRAPVPPPIYTLPGSSEPDSGYLEPIKSPSNVQQAQKSRTPSSIPEERENEFFDDEYLVPGDATAGQPVPLDDDYMAPTSC